MDLDERIIAKARFKRLQFWKRALPCYHQSSFNFWFAHHSAATRITSDLAQVKYDDNPLARIRRSVLNSALSGLISRD
jgi:hypothetical protein